jgi:hypothetical protein
LPRTIIPASPPARSSCPGNSRTLRPPSTPALRLVPAALSRLRRLPHVHVTRASPSSRRPSRSRVSSCLPSFLPLSPTPFCPLPPRTCSAARPLLSCPSSAPGLRLSRLLSLPAPSRVPYYRASHVVTVTASRSPAHPPRTAHCVPRTTPPRMTSPPTTVRPPQGGVGKMTGAGGSKSFILLASFRTLTTRLFFLAVPHTNGWIASRPRPVPRARAVAGAKIKKKN